LKAVNALRQACSSVGVEGVIPRPRALREVYTCPTEMPFLR
jgi:hypothetical protein